MTTRDAIFSHFSSILDNLLSQTSFFQRYFQYPVYIYDIEGSNNGAIPPNIHLHFGVSRGCILDDNFPDWAVKFNLGDADCCNCITEIDHYESATRAHLQQYFAQPMYIGSYERVINTYPYESIDSSFDWVDFDEDYFKEQIELNKDFLGDKEKIYIQVSLYAYPRASSHFYGVRGCDEDKYLHDVIYSSPECDISSEVATELVRCYGEDEYQRLVNFLVNEGINDIHCGNVGDIAGKFVILDYSGY